jgi:nitrilase
LAKASRDRAEYVYADIDPSLADDKRRPDGTDLFTSRRPELYRAIAQNPAGQALPQMTGAAELIAAITELSLPGDLIEACARTVEARAAGAALICLPPLTGDLEDLPQAAVWGEQVVRDLSAVCDDAHVATAIIRPDDCGGFQYCAVLVGSDGLVLAQPQVHASTRHAFSAKADDFRTADLPCGRVALVTSDDSLFPETFRLLAMAGVEVALLPLSPLEDWELNTGLLERSAENRINLLVAPDSVDHGAGFITCLQTDFTVMTEWHNRPFDGLLSQPQWHRNDQHTAVSTAVIRPANAANKVVSMNTDLLADRPWQLCAAIAR